MSFASLQTLVACSTLLAVGHLFPAPALPSPGWQQRHVAVAHPESAEFLSNTPSNSAIAVSITCNPSRDAREVLFIAAALLATATAVAPRQRATTATTLANAVRHRNRIDVTSAAGCVQAALNRRPRIVLTGPVNAR